MSLESDALFMVEPDDEICSLLAIKSGDAFGEWTGDEIDLALAQAVSDDAQEILQTMLEELEHDPAGIVQYQIVEV